MMSIDKQFEREEEFLIEELNAGRMTRAEFDKQMRELARDYRQAAQEAAQDAYDEEMGNW
jgi:hypothetical protein